MRFRPLKWIRVYPVYRLTRYDPLVRRGLLATVLFLLAVSAYALSIGCRTTDLGPDCRRQIAWFWSGAPNNFGDTLAGLASALAFLWIIVTVMLQSKELAAQRQELRLARRESAKMAAALEAQAAVFRDEQRSRKEQEADALCRELLENVWEAANEMLTWHWWPEGPHQNPYGESTAVVLFSGVSGSTDTVENIRRVYEACQRNLPRLERAIMNGEIAMKMPKPPVGTDIVNYLERVSDLFEEGCMSLAQQARLERSNALQIYDLLWNLFEDERFWDEPLA